MAVAEPELEEPSQIIREAVLQFEESHPAADHLMPSVWISRVCEQLGLLVIAVKDHEDLDPDLDENRTISLLARLSSAGAEAVRAAARHHPDADPNQPAFDLIDWTLEMLDEGAQDPDAASERDPSECVIAATAMLGTAAAGAIAIDAELRGEGDSQDRASAITPGQDDVATAQMFARGMFHVAEICRAGIAWVLRERSGSS